MKEKSKKSKTTSFKCRTYNFNPAVQRIISIGRNKNNHIIYNPENSISRYQCMYIYFKKQDSYMKMMVGISMMETFQPQAKMGCGTIIFIIGYLHQRELKL